MINFNLKKYIIFPIFQEHKNIKLNNFIYISKGVILGCYILACHYELHSSLIVMVKENPFSGEGDENPYIHT